MHNKVNVHDLKILFMHTSVEELLKSLASYETNGVWQETKITAYNYDKELYREAGMTESEQRFTRDELYARHGFLEDKLRSEHKADGVFGLLSEFLDNVLFLQNDMPVCDAERITEWRDLHLLLGQDLMTTCWLAHREAEQRTNTLKDYTYLWPAVIETNDLQLNHLLRRGLAENHYHLNGSTQSFMLTWLCLMNHPRFAYEFLQGEKRRGDFFKDRMLPGRQYHYGEGSLSWHEQILLAAKIRARLFMALFESGSNADDNATSFKLSTSPFYAEDAQRQVQGLRALFGTKIRTEGRRQHYCADYCMSTSLYNVNEEHHNRALTGERALLCNCFYRIFTGQAGRYEASLLYLYILIKNRFRAEMIQVNQVKGFDNFSAYQDRKDVVFSKFPGYRCEALRLSAIASLREGHVSLEEARFVPATSMEKLSDDLSTVNKSLQRQMREVAQQDDIELPLFYVVHFPKRRFNKGEYKNLLPFSQPRNWKVRQDAKARALSIKELIEHGLNEEPAIKGIDACSHEIGCRPETFATEFRFLRNETMVDQKSWQANPGRSALGVTYHVGEDFLDIMDGLRATDEAMRFLSLNRGDRLGHALALGTDPYAYYKAKEGQIVLPAQDLLDNLVWSLKKADDWGIPLDSHHRNHMDKLARELFSDIFGSLPSDYYLSYFDSWRLRGDHPDLYKTGLFREPTGVMTACGYERFMKGNPGLRTLRQDEKVSWLYFLYHYDSDVKDRGLKSVSMRIEPWYAEFVERLQRHIRYRIARKGICIECNPTSNILIGAFRDYDEHPIFKFFPYDESDDGSTPHILVSINTDDIGVFDTSLANEYALVYDALKKMTKKQGRIEDDRIMEYLERLRMNGFMMSFGSTTT